jgi:hypothetical protein
MQPTTTPPKKYVQGKDGSNKLVLNPEYKTWMKEKLYHEETNSRTDTTTPTVLSMSTTTDPVAISYETDETDIPTAVAAASCEDIPIITAVHVYDDDDVQSCLSEPSMMTETSEQEQRIEMLRSENQRLLEIANLRTERDRLEEANRASEDVRRLQEENERLKKEKKTTQEIIRGGRRGGGGGRNEDVRVDDSTRDSTRTILQRYDTRKTLFGEMSSQGKTGSNNQGADQTSVDYSSEIRRQQVICRDDPQRGPTRTSL